MRILISNDDGVEAEGIVELATAIGSVADVTVVAPDKNRSASSASLTLDSPFRCKQLENGFYQVSGTPCDCVHLGLHRIMQSRVDMVIAGINHGANLGDDVIYSGTVAAAMEGRSLGYPAVAISMASHQAKHLKSAARIMLDLLQRIKDHPLDGNIILNINVPDLPLEQIKGVKTTRLGSRHRADTIVKSQDPRNNPIYWIGPPSQPQDVGQGTDFEAISAGYVSVTPLVVDLTAYQHLEQISKWLDN
ncbi:MAG: 5'/3'-nucleotidase SurE [Enterobacterales bacterium]|nr:5'/3'-nucleotidase SurE [Enterobacterales bacterium]